MPFICNILLSKPRIQIQHMEDAFTEVQLDNLTSETSSLSDFRMEILEEMLGSNALEDQLVFISKMEATTQSMDTILDGNLWITQYHLQHIGLQNYHLGVRDEFGDLTETYHATIKTGCEILISNLHGENEADQVLSKYLIGRFVAINRYCKLAMLQYWNSDGHRQISWSPSRLLLSSQLTSDLDNEATKVTKGDGEGAHGFYYIDLHYIVRLNVDGNYYIVDDSMEGDKSTFKTMVMRNISQDMTVDVMFINPSLVTWFFLPSNMCSNMCLDTTGHFPILAGKTSYGKPLYVSSEDLMFRSHTIACVTEGQSLSNFTNGIYILCLRHDPSDTHPPYPDIPDGAMDQTGPLYWLKFWPAKDPNFPTANDLPWATGELDCIKKFLNLYSESASLMGSSDDCLSIFNNSLKEAWLALYQEEGGWWHEFEWWGFPLSKNISCKPDAQVSELDGAGGCLQSQETGSEEGIVLTDSGRDEPDNGELKLASQ